MTLRTAKLHFADTIITNCNNYTSKQLGRKLETCGTGD